MGAKKLQSLFADSKSKGDKTDSVRQKQEIEVYKKAIADKLKDPELAKKAGQILESWINKK